MTMGDYTMAGVTMEIAGLMRQFIEASAVPGSASSS
jgi:hypothetical protein